MNKRFIQHITPWWKSEEKKVAWIGLITLLILSVMSVYLEVVLNDWGKKFFEAIEQKDMATFIYQIKVFIPIVSIVLLRFCTANYLSTWFTFRWRQWMTSKLQAQWLAHKNYYKIAFNHVKILDNPDQRITQDIQSITSLTIELFFSFFREGINFITFSIILWHVSNGLTFALFGRPLIIPGLFVWVAILYSIIGTLVTFKIGHSLISLERSQERYEADFRYRLMRLFERREEVASLQGEPFEKGVLTATFQAIKENYYHILFARIPINLFQNFYMNGSTFIPLFIAGPLYFSGAITLGILMQIRNMFQQVQGSLSAVLLSFNTIVSLIASLQRIDEFKKYLTNESVQNTGTHLEISQVTLLNPKNEVIWQVPHIVLLPGQRKLLMAPSGRGKTSLLRVIAGIYPFYTINSEGIMSIPANIMLIPQRPYMPLGSLADCLSYPAFTQFERDELSKVMRICHLQHLEPYLDEVKDYQEMLSLGEQQRVNFARALLHRPKWLMMDEPIAHVDEGLAQDLCSHLLSELKETTMLIISHKELEGFELLDFAD